jgi:hypothetical protein
MQNLLTDKLDQHENSKNPEKTKNIKIGNFLDGIMK